MKFVKTNIQDTKGRGKSKYDDLLSEFTQEGDALQFEEEDLSRASASQAAKRLMKISGKKFHSYYDVLEKKVTIRLRKSDELQLTDEEPSDKEETSEQEEE